MAQERPTTPEKQLLDLIEDPKDQAASQKRRIARRPLGFLSLSALRGRLSFLRDHYRSAPLLKNPFLDIKGLNRMLKISIFLLLVYMGVNFAVSMNRLKRPPEFAVKDRRSTAGASLALMTGKKLSFYLEGPRSRDIFKFGDFGFVEPESNEEVSEVAAPVEEVESPAEILAQQLGLVGIGWSDDPDVMVENVETKKIYFLKRGARIDGLIKVEAIFEDKVILTYDNGKELELR